MHTFLNASVGILVLTKNDACHVSKQRMLQPEGEPSGNSGWKQNAHRQVWCSPTLAPPQIAEVYSLPAELAGKPKIEKGVCQGCLLSPCLFNLYTEYIMRNAGLDELQAGIKIGGRNINSLKYVDDTTLMAESEEELKSLLMMVKEKSQRSGLN